MSQSLLFSVFLLSGSTLIALFLARYAWLRRPALGATRFTVLMLAVATWCGGYALELMLPGLAGFFGYEATIQYLSGESKRHSGLEVKGLVTFAVMRPKGTLVAWNRLASEPLSRRFQLLRRGSPDDPSEPGEEIL